MPEEKADSQRIEPRTLRGFQDYLPAQQFHRQRILDTLREVTESFGYKPLDTPILESQETLFGSSGDQATGVDANKQTYRFEDLGGEEVALRYEHTVSLARAVAQHSHDIVIPFRRYQSGPVFRYDKPKRGRYRQFVQFDADLIGDSDLSADAECMALCYEWLAALGIDDFNIRWSNRKVIAELLDLLGIDERALQLDFLSIEGPDGHSERTEAETFSSMDGLYEFVLEKLSEYGDLEEAEIRDSFALGERLGGSGSVSGTYQFASDYVASYAITTYAQHKLVFRALDKLDSIGYGGVKAELMGERDTDEEQRSALQQAYSLALSEEQADRLLDFVQIEGDFGEVIDQVRDAFGDAAQDSEGIEELERTAELAEASGVDQAHSEIDLSLARGLDYYTGTIFEVELTGVDKYGSVGGGGRYDDLLSRFSEEQIPGIGISIGVDRLFMALWEDGRLEERESNTDIVVINFGAEHEGTYLEAARRLREAGVVTEVFPDDRGLGKQFRYADKIDAPLALIGGPRELDDGVWQIKELTEEFGDREEKQEEVADEEMVQEVVRLLERSPAAE